MDAGWLAIKVKCRLCGNEHVAVAPAETGGENLECSRCHFMSCDAVRDYDTALDMTAFWRWLKDSGLG